MQKLVIDTNVFVSYLISSSGYSFKIIDGILLNKQAIHFISNDIFREYFEVFNRTRFAKKYPEFSKKAILLLNSLSELSLVAESVKLLKIKDESDNRFLELAFTISADYLITGNKLHFTFDSFHNTKIVSPKEYWESYKP